MKAVNWDKTCRYNVTAKKTIQKDALKNTVVFEHGVQKKCSINHRKVGRRKVKNEKQNKSMNRKQRVKWHN